MTSQVCTLQICKKSVTYRPTDTHTDRQTIPFRRCFSHPKHSYQGNWKGFLGYGRSRTFYSVKNKKKGPVLVKGSRAALRWVPVWGKRISNFMLASEYYVEFFSFFRMTTTKKWIQEYLETLKHTDTHIHRQTDTHTHTHRQTTPAMLNYSPPRNCKFRRGQK